MVLFYPADKKLAYLSRVHSIEMMISTYLMIHFPLLMWKSLDISWTSIFDPINRLILSFFSSRCILGKLHSKVCILVTHQIQFLKYATKIIFLDKVNYRKIFFLYYSDFFRAFKSLQELTLNYFAPVLNLHNGRKRLPVNYGQVLARRILPLVN